MQELASISERNLAPILTLLVASWRGPTVTIKNKEREQCPLYKNSLLNDSCVLCARAKHDLKSERTRYLTISHSFVPNAKVKCLSVSNCGFSPEDIRRVVGELHYVFDFTGLDEAQQHYENSPY